MCIRDRNKIDPIAYRVSQTIGIFHRMKRPGAISPPVIDSINYGSGLVKYPPAIILKAVTFDVGVGVARRRARKLVAYKDPGVAIIMQKVIADQGFERKRVRRDKTAWPLRKKRQSIVRTFVNLVARDKNYIRFWACPVSYTHLQTVREASLATFQRFEDIFTRLIQRGIDEGTFAPIDPNAGAQALLSIASGTFMRSLLDPQRTDWGKIAEESIEILINGLKRRSV